MVGGVFIEDGLTITTGGVHVEDGDVNIQNGALNVRENGAIITSELQSVSPLVLRATDNNFDETIFNAQTTRDPSDEYNMYRYETATETMSLFSGDGFKQETVLSNDNRALYHLRRARDSGGSPSAVSDGEILRHIEFQGYGGTDYQPSAGIRAAVDETIPSDTAMGGSLLFYTSEATTNTLEQRILIDSTGVVTIGNTPNERIVITPGVEGQIRAQDELHLDARNDVEVTSENGDISLIADNNIVGIAQNGFVDVDSLLTQSYSSGGQTTIETTDQTGSAGADMLLQTGASDIATGGSISILTGASTGSTSGQLELQTGESTTGSSGTVVVASGDSSGAQSGAVSLHSGATVTANSGLIAINTGTSTSGASGNILVASGQSTIGLSGTVQV